MGVRNKIYRTSVKTAILESWRGRDEIAVRLRHLKAVRRRSKVECRSRTNATQLYARMFRRWYACGSFPAAALGKAFTGVMHLLLIAVFCGYGARRPFFALGLCETGAPRATA